jgi:hypothetical protein
VGEEEGRIENKEINPTSCRIEITLTVSKQEREQYVIEALASTGDVTKPYSSPIHAVSKVLGVTFEVSLRLVEDMTRRRVVQLVPRLGSFRVDADPSPAYRWERGPTPPGEEPALEPKAE